ncbi:Hypothetical_protein [Hexamita inflata]|uniref:Hypothetical_protein n=1 Tax=Hexamita inflata TaxID=28002 RepID=A0AA86P4N4_9EUKA|nr:Hypothetical protein HINF_LOCUS19827 [Hexamita inflata]
MSGLDDVSKILQKYSTKKQQPSQVLKTRDLQVNDVNSLQQSSIKLTKFQTSESEAKPQQPVMPKPLTEKDLLQDIMLQQTQRVQTIEPETQTEPKQIIKEQQQQINIENVKNKDILELKETQQFILNQIEDLKTEIQNVKDQIGDIHVEITKQNINTNKQMELILQAVQQIKKAVV